MVFWIFKKT